MYEQANKPSRKLILVFPVPENAVNSFELYLHGWLTYLSSCTFNVYLLFL